MKLNVRSVEEQYTRALELVQSGNTIGAMFHLQNVLLVNPDHQSARNDLGALYFKKGELEQALIHLKRACELKPSDEVAWQNLGAVCQVLGINKTNRD